MVLLNCNSLMKKDQKYTQYISRPNNIPVKSLYKLSQEFS